MYHSYIHIYTCQFFDIKYLSQWRAEGNLLELAVDALGDRVTGRHTLRQELRHHIATKTIALPHK